MKENLNEKLSDALTDVDDGYIVKTARPPMKTKNLWIRYGALAACLALIGSAVALWAVMSRRDQISEPLHKVKEIDDYTVLLYESAAGFAGDIVTTAYSGEKLFHIEDFDKSDMPPKKDLFGKDVNMHYSGSQKTNLNKCNIDLYFYIVSGTYVAMKINDQTGKIVSYDTGGWNFDRNYKSTVNPKSGEKEFLTYAKNILWEYGGASTDDKKVRIVTKIISEDGSVEFKDGFVNYFDENPNFNAQYTFFFTGDIDGIARCDDMQITVTNVGEICSFEALQFDEAYAPFENAKIDRDKIISTVEKAFSSVRNSYNVLSYSITLQTIPKETELWVEATVEFEFQGGEEHILTSGVKYVVKVAELLD